VELRGSEDLKDFCHKEHKDYKENYSGKKEGFFCHGWDGLAQMGKEIRNYGKTTL